MGKVDPLFTPAKNNRTVQLTRDLIALGEGTPEIGFATNVGTVAEPLWRSGAGWVGKYFTTNSLGRVVRAIVPKEGLTKEQNELSNEAAGSFYRDALYQRYPEFAKSMPSEAMAVMGDVFHHGRQENEKTPVWDKDNQAVWAARNNDKNAQAYLLGRGYSNKWDFNEIAARQILDYTRDSGTNRIYRRLIQRFNVLRPKLGKNKRPWDYFDPKTDKAKKDAMTIELRKAWAEVNKGEQADENGGQTENNAVYQGSEKPATNAQASTAQARLKKSSRVKADMTDVKEIGKDQLDSKLWPDTSRYGRLGSFFQASNPDLPWLTQYYINIGNGPGARANSLAIPTTVPPTVEAVRKTAQFIWDRHHVDDGSWGALTLQDLKRELWAHARAEKLRNGVNRWANNTIQWANIAPQGNSAAFIAGGVRAVANGLAGAFGVSVTDVGHDDLKVKAYNLVDNWDKKEAEYMREGKYGRREDGSFKGDGWLGPLEITMPDGSKSVATEYSIGVNVNGKDMDIPSLVPTLTPREVEMMKEDIIPNGKPVPKEIAEKAVKFARSRIGKGQSVWVPDATEASRAAEIRQAAKGGESESSGETTETTDSVNNEAVADAPVTGGPRIVINPSTFRNKKDALCVAFNERFRIAMEQYGFEPQSEPTPKQRRFFADTAYTDDEVQLRRTIIARILTLDTSVKDPTDEQLAEAGEFLQAFKEREQPSNDWEAAAVDRIAELVAAVKPAGLSPAAPRTEGSTYADIGGGATDDEDKKFEPQGVKSGVFANGRELTAREAEWQEQRASRLEEREKRFARDQQNGEQDQQAGQPQGVFLQPGQIVGLQPMDGEQNAQEGQQGAQGIQGAQDGQQNGREDEQTGWNPKGVKSGVFANGRELTAREAEWQEQRNRRI